MSTPQWVQHISGQGEKWEVSSLRLTVDGDPTVQWLVKDPVHKGYLHYLPRSEYRLCDPPEQWEDVTDRCSAECWAFDPDNPQADHYNAWLIADRGYTIRSGGYRLRKVRCGKALGINNPDWAFIVERRKT